VTKPQTLYILKVDKNFDCVASMKSVFQSFVGYINFKNQCTDWKFCYVFSHLRFTILSLFV